jgi:very-short-patch-repair endonuclease
MPPLVDVLTEVVGCLPALDALAILDSAREFLPSAWTPPLLNDAGFSELLERLPPEQLVIALRSSSLSQAVGETVARERFRQAGVHAQPQVELPGGYRADLLIGDRLIFECEGFDPHSGHDAFQTDRERMAWLRACGYTVLNFSHTQIVEDWPSVLSTVLLVMRRGAHLAA